MADPVAVIRAQLVGAAAIAALVGDRVGPAPLAQGDGLASIVLQVISTVPTSHLTGDGDLYQVRIQVTCKAASDAAARALAALVRGVLFTEDQILDNDIDEYDDVTREYLVIQDYLISIHPSA